ncbi:MAG: hypothetical protein KJZ87_23215, partial [Thermoguttaceae bacterium]|nr:hypothetical protein [Thermoguttaceae bacterium]
KARLVWYHFSSHPVCYTDDLSGPDWPGLVAERVKNRHGVVPSFLQGHCGDVNPGDGQPWLGIPEKVADAVAAGIDGALGAAQPVDVDRLEIVHQPCGLPLDIPLFRTWLDEYARNPADCNRGPWVDAGFAADWARASAKRNLDSAALSVPLSAMRLGNVAMVFHPAELYSYYGLAIRRDSPFAETIVVGYTDDSIGYLPDPKAYEAGEYAAMVVPKILDLPPFTPQAAAKLGEAAVGLLKRLG